MQIAADLVTTCDLKWPKVTFRPAIFPALFVLLGVPQGALVSGTETETTGKQISDRDYMHIYMYYPVPYTQFGTPHYAWSYK